MIRPEKDRNYDEMRNPDRNLKQGAPMPVRQNNGGEVLARMKRDKRSGRKMERWMAKEDYTKKKDESKYRMPIVRDSEKSPHYNMRMPDKSTIRKKQRETKRTWAGS